MSTSVAASAGSVQAFAGRALPRVVRSLVAGARRVVACQRLGSAFERALALEEVEIALRSEDAGDGDAGSEGIVYAASRSGRFAPPSSVLTSPSGEIVLRVDFPDAERERWLRPILEVSLALVDLGPSNGAAAAAPRAGQEPSPPEPLTLDPAVEEIYDHARRIAEGDIGVLIRGASGSGKEVLADFIHRASRRAGEAFVALNCAALPHDLLEAELFGVERGVATGVEPRPGLFERAHGGTLFLDEIGDMAADTQARILRVMQDGEVCRLGGSRPRPAQARIIAATNRDLEAMLAAGTFRNDLFHRLADWQVTLPTLVERRADIPNLAAFFLDREAARTGLICGGIGRGALELLLECPWPGNVRQLERQMVRATLFLEDGEPLGLRHLESLAASDGPRCAAESTLEAHLACVEREAIEDALAACGGDVVQASARLEVGRSTLYRRINHLGIAAGE